RAAGGGGGGRGDVDVGAGPARQVRRAEVQRAGGDGPPRAGPTGVDGPAQAGVGGQGVGDRVSLGRAHPGVGHRDHVADGVPGVDGGGVGHLGDGDGGAVDHDPHRSDRGGAVVGGGDRGGVVHRAAGGGGGGRGDVDVDGGPCGQVGRAVGQVTAHDGEPGAGVGPVDGPGQAGVGGKGVVQAHPVGRPRPVVGDGDHVADGVTGRDAGVVRGLGDVDGGAQHGDRGRGGVVPQAPRRLVGGASRGGVEDGGAVLGGGGRGHVDVGGGPRQEEGGAVGQVSGDDAPPAV